MQLYTSNGAKQLHFTVDAVQGLSRYSWSLHSSHSSHQWSFLTCLLWSSKSFSHSSLLDLQHSMAGMQAGQHNSQRSSCIVTKSRLCADVVSRPEGMLLCSFVGFTGLGLLGLQQSNTLQQQPLPHCSLARLHHHHSSSETNPHHTPFAQ